MWRIHLTADDLARVRLARGVDPLWEILHSVHMLGCTSGEVLFGAWRRRCRQRPVRRLDALLTMAPTQGYSPDFLTPATGSTDLDAGIETVLRTPCQQLRDDLGRLAGSRSLPSWVGDLATGRPDLLRDLGRLMRAYFEASLAPHWPQIHGQLYEELLLRGSELATGGVEHLLATVSPLLRHEGSVLVVTSKPGHREIHLDGRGIVLQPSFFAYDDVSVLQLPEQPLVLAYPVRHRIDWFAGAVEPGRRQLEALIGRTRSQALQVLAMGDRTTTDLAGCLGVSAASASQQTRILREAGLIVSDHQGKAVIHRASTLGKTLLNGSACR